MKIDHAGRRVLVIGVGPAFEERSEESAARVASEFYAGNRVVTARGPAAAIDGDEMA